MLGFIHRVSDNTTTFRNAFYSRLHLIRERTQHSNLNSRDGASLKIRPKSIVLSSHRSREERYRTNFISIKQNNVTENLIYLLKYEVII
jgi:hypothetical protein